MQDLEKLYNEMVTEKQKIKEELERRKGEWKVVKTYKNIQPSGGENGRDGYVDAEYESKDGEIIRMVNRNVFDVGCYSYPKRLEGNNNMFKQKWTESEKQLSVWLSKFGFRGIRM